MVQGGRWGGVVRQGRGHFKPAAEQRPRLRRQPRAAHDVLSPQQLRLHQALPARVVLLLLGATVTVIGLQAVGRKLGMYLRRRIRVRQEGERRNIFLRYLGEVANAVSEINRADRKDLYDKLLKIATKKTAEADVKLDSRGRPIEEDLDLGSNVLIVDPNEAADNLSVK